jgi:hypothetical protein
MSEQSSGEQPTRKILIDKLITGAPFPAPRDERGYAIDDGRERKIRELFGKALSDLGYSCIYTNEYPPAEYPHFNIDYRYLSWFNQTQPTAGQEDGNLLWLENKLWAVRPGSDVVTDINYTHWFYWLGGPRKERERVREALKLAGEQILDKYDLRAREGKDLSRVSRYVKPELDISTLLV